MKLLLATLLLLATTAATVLAGQHQTALGSADATTTRQQVPDWTDLKARMKMAAVLLNGIGVERDVERAIGIYESAAAEGVAFAQYRLGRIYLDGEFVPPRPELAFDWLLRAARLGFVDAQVDLSQLYADGLGIEPDLVEAHKWLNLASSLGAVNLENRQADLEQRMSFGERVKARYRANKCKLNRYENC